MKMYYDNTYLTSLSEMTFFQLRKVWISETNESKIQCNCEDDKFQMLKGFTFLKIKEDGDKIH